MQILRCLWLKGSREGLLYCEAKGEAESVRRNKLSPPSACSQKEV